MMIRSKHCAAFSLEGRVVGRHIAPTFAKRTLIQTEARGKWDLREMRIISMMCPALILAGCTFLNDAPPKVIYQSSDTISVEYPDDGLMRVNNRQEALEMIERHCGGPYRIVGGLGAY